MKHFLARLSQMVLILAGLSVFLFVLMLNMPGNPVDLLITSNPRIKPEDVIRLKKLKGLDQPWYVQYARWMWGYYEPTAAPVIEPNDFRHGEEPKATRPSMVSGLLRSARNDDLPGYARALFSGQISGGRRWFVVKNQAGLESVGSVVVEGHEPKNLWVRPIANQIIDKPEDFSVDLNRYVAGDGKDLKYELLDHSPGKIDAKGVYTWPQKALGQKAISFSVTNAQGQKAFGAFAVEQDPIPNYKIFNRGFIFVFIGDTQAMGFSSAYKRPVWDLLSGRIFNTLALMIPAILLSLLIALPLGIISACRQYSWFDYILNFLAFVGISLPVFWFGIMVMYVFAEYLQWFPAGGI